MTIVRNLVFEGGGIKGLAYVGALRALAARGHLKTVEQVAGASAGAITALILALGYSLTEVEAMLDMDFAEFQDSKRWTRLGKAQDILSNFGIHPGESFVKWIAEKIVAKLGNRDATFADLHQAVEQQNNVDSDSKFRDVHMIVANLNIQKAEVFSYYQTPDVPLVMAIRASMSIPFFFRPVTDNKGELYVDGGLADNFPITLFDTDVICGETLGLKVDAPSEISSLRDAQQPPAQPINNIVQCTFAVVRTAMSAQSNRQKWNNPRTIFIDIGNIGATQFALTPAQKQTLITAGEQAVDDFFKRFRPEQMQLQNQVDPSKLTRLQKTGRYAIYAKANFIVTTENGLQYLIFYLAKEERLAWERKTNKYFEQLTESSAFVKVKHYKNADNNQHILELQPHPHLRSELNEWVLKHNKQSLHSTETPAKANWTTLRTWPTLRHSMWTVPKHEFHQKQLEIVQAFEQGNVKTIMQLIKAGATLNYRDMNGDTLMHLAVRIGNIKLINALLDRKLDVNAVNRLGQTALHYAINSLTQTHAPRTEIVATLLKRNADANLRDNNGNNALTIAENMGREDVVPLLRPVTNNGPVNTIRYRI